METTEEKKGYGVSFYVMALVYVLFNLRLASEPLSSLFATLKQIAVTAPYVVGITFVIISFIQHMAEGEKVAWSQRLRLFFTIGIFAGLVYGIYDYTGTAIPQ